MITGVGSFAAPENERQASPFDFETWMRNSRTLLHSTGADGCLVGASEAWLAKLGYSRQEAIGRPLADFLAPGSLALEASLRGGCESVAGQFLAKDGHLIDVLACCLLGAGPHGLSTAAIIDVTATKDAERKLAAELTQYRSLVEEQAELVSLASVEGRLLYVNEAFARHFERRPEELIGKSMSDFVPKEAHSALEHHLRRLRESRRSLTSKNQVVLPNGRLRWISWTNRALCDEFGAVTAIHSVGRDVEHTVEAERRLKESEARYRLLAEHSTDMVLELDANLQRRYVSPACREMFGYEPEELIGGTTGGMAHPEDAERLSRALQRLLKGEVDRETVIVRRSHRDGRWIWVETHYRAVRDAQSGATTGIIATARDISERKAVEDRLAEANSQLEAAAREDGLTGLANRRTFDDALAREFGRARRDNRNLSLVMIDVDRFKLFNDRYGHPAGDECLRKIGKTLAGAVFRPGDLAARYGGEEFALLLPDTDERGAAAIAERVRRSVEHLAIAHEDAPRGMMTVSAGVAAMDRRSSLKEGRETLVQRADNARYRAKRSRNLVVRASAPHAPGAMSPNAA